MTSDSLTFRQTNRASDRRSARDKDGTVTALTEAEIKVLDVCDYFGELSGADWFRSDIPDYRDAFRVLMERGFITTVLPRYELTTTGRAALAASKAEIADK